jgi:uncharacterized cupin superfamily protein
VNTAAFERQMAEDGFSTPIPGHYEPGRFNEAHTHPFEVRGLILSGEMTITPIGGVGTCYRPGDVFVMPLAAPHQEHVGPEGCTYLWGRREPSSAAD